MVVVGAADRLRAVRPFPLGEALYVEVQVVERLVEVGGAFYFFALVAGQAVFAHFHVPFFEGGVDVDRPGVELALVEEEHRPVGVGEPAVGQGAAALRHQAQRGVEQGRAFEVRQCVGFASVFLRPAIPVGEALAAGVGKQRVVGGS